MEKAPAFADETYAGRFMGAVLEAVEAMVVVRDEAGPEAPRAKRPLDLICGKYGLQLIKNRLETRRPRGLALQFRVGDEWLPVHPVAGTPEDRFNLTWTESMLVWVPLRPLDPRLLDLYASLRYDGLGPEEAWSTTNRCAAEPDVDCKASQHPDVGGRLST